LRFNPSVTLAIWYERVRRCWKTFFAFVGLFFGLRLIGFYSENNFDILVRFFDYIGFGVNEVWWAWILVIISGISFAIGLIYHYLRRKNRRY